MLEERLMTKALYPWQNARAGDSHHPQPLPHFCISLLGQLYGSTADPVSNTTKLIFPQWEAVQGLGVSRVSSEGL